MLRVKKPAWVRRANNGQQDAGWRSEAVGSFWLAQPWRESGVKLRGTSGMVQKGVTLSQIFVNQPFRWLSVRVPLETIWMLASATL